jgi:hypothetical protein
VKEATKQRRGRQQDDCHTAAEEEQNAIAIAQKRRARGVKSIGAIPACFARHKQRKRAPGQANDGDQRHDGKDAAVVGWVQSVADNRLKGKAQHPSQNRAGTNYEVMTDDAVSSES